MNPQCARTALCFGVSHILIIKIIIFTPLAATSAASGRDGMIGCFYSANDKECLIRLSIHLA